MKEVDLNNLTTEAKESITALFSLLAGDNKEVRLSIGGRHTYTITIVEENATTPDRGPGRVPASTPPPQTDAPVHGDAPQGEMPTKVAHG